MADSSSVGKNSSSDCPEPWKLPIVQVQGTWMPKYDMFSYDKFNKALDYKAQPGDIFIATYPKNGTTWMQYICWEIKNRGASPLHVNSVMSKEIPFIEMFGPECVDAVAPPKYIKTHFAFKDCPWNEQSRYIHVARNPKDTLVSFYHHHKIRSRMASEIIGSHFGFDNFDFDDYFECFMRGELPWGDYFDHVAGWWAHKDDPNVLSLTYEAMKADPRGAVLRVAKFTGDDYHRMLSDDEEMLEKVVLHSDFKYLKSLGMGSFEIGADMSTVGQETRRDTSRINFFRKGVVGDWKNHLSDEQNRRLEEKAREKFKSTGIPELWRKSMDM